MAPVNWSEILTCEDKFPGVSRMMSQRYPVILSSYILPICVRRFVTSLNTVKKIIQWVDQFKIFWYLSHAQILYTVSSIVTSPPNSSRNNAKHLVYLWILFTADKNSFIQHCLFWCFTSQWTIFLSGRFPVLLGWTCTKPRINFYSVLILLCSSFQRSVGFTASIVFCNLKLTRTHLMARHR